MAFKCLIPSSITFNACEMWLTLFIKLMTTIGPLLISSGMLALCKPFDLTFQFLFSRGRLLKASLSMDWDEFQAQETGLSNERARRPLVQVKYGTKLLQKHCSYRIVHFLVLLDHRQGCRQDCGTHATKAGPAIFLVKLMEQILSLSAKKLPSSSFPWHGKHFDKCFES